MPTVPRRDPASVVKLEPLPNVRATAAPTEESFGGGASAEKLSAANKGFSDSVFKLALSQKEALDTAMVNEIDISLSKQRNEIMQEVDRDFQGSKAVGIQEHVEDRWQKVMEETNKRIKNDNQKAKVYKKAATYYGQIDNHGRERMFVEGERFKLDSTNATVASSQENAALNWTKPDVVQQELNTMMVTREAYAKDQGFFGSPQYAKMIADDKSDFVKNQINKRLADNQPGAAKEYYDANKDSIVGKEADAYGKYIDAETKRIEANAVNVKKQTYDDTNRKVMLDSFEGNVSLGEIQRLYRLDVMNESDYKYWQNFLTSPDFQAYRNKLNIDEKNSSGVNRVISDPVIFNEIRQLQIGDSVSQPEIDRIIMEQQGKTLNREDAYYLTKINNGKPLDERGRQIQTQIDHVRGWAQNYLKTGLSFTKPTAPSVGLGGILGALPTVTLSTEDQKTNQTETVVNNFIKKVDEEDAKGDRIDEIAREVITEQIKKEDPSLAGYENLSDIVLDINGKVKNLFLSPFKGEKPKPKYKLVRVEGGLKEDKPKKEK